MGTKIEPKEFKMENWGKETIEKLYQAGLLDFLKKFNGHNDKIAQEFIEHLEHGQTRIGEISIPMNQTFLSQALDLPLIREEYHKGLNFKENGWTFFLEKQRKGSFDRTRGILIDWLREPWSELILIIQK